MDLIVQFLKSVLIFVSCFFVLSLGLMCLGGNEDE